MSGCCLSPSHPRSSFNKDVVMEDLPPVQGNAGSAGRTRTEQSWWETHRVKGKMLKDKGRGSLLVLGKAEKLQRERSYQLSGFRKGIAPPRPPCSSACVDQMEAPSCTTLISCPQFLIITFLPCHFPNFSSRAQCQDLGLGYRLMIWKWIWSPEIRKNF